MLSTIRYRRKQCVFRNRYSSLGPGPFPGVLDLWGGGGGLVEYRSALLASRGYVALSLEYLGRVDANGKPYEVDNEYFEVFTSKVMTSVYFSCACVNIKE